MIKDMMKIIAKNLMIAAIAVIAYSPGLLDLRPQDPSILRAGMSIFLVPLLLTAFYFANKSLLSKQNVIYENGGFFKIMDTDKAVIKDLEKKIERLNNRESHNTAHFTLEYLKKIYFALNIKDDDAVREKIDFYITSFQDLLNTFYKLEISWTDTDACAEVYLDNLNALKTIQQVFKNILSDLADDDDKHEIITAHARLDGYEDDDLLNKY